MTVLLENPHDDLHDVRLATRARGLLAEFNAAGVLTAADVHVATTVGRLCGESNDDVLLAAALAVRAVREGSVCLDLAEAHRSAGDVDDPADLEALPWPEPSAWLAACVESPLIAVGVDGPEDRPLRLVDGLLYLDRYWREEQLVRDRAGHPHVPHAAGCRYRTAARCAGSPLPRARRPTCSASRWRPASPAG